MQYHIEGNANPKFAIEPYDDVVKKWIPEIEKKHGVKITKEDILEARRRLFTQGSPGNYWYIMLQIPVAMQVMKTREGQEIEDIDFNPISSIFVTQNVVLERIIEIIAEEKKVDYYIEELLGKKIVGEDGIVKSLDEVLKEDFPEIYGKMEEEESSVFKTDINSKIKNSVRTFCEKLYELFGIELSLVKGPYSGNLKNLITHLSRIESDNKYILFTGSWKDRFLPGILALPENFCIRDFRFPVKMLNYLWHNLRFPPLEWLVGKVDLSHSPTPLLLPARKGKRVITIHDLFFLRRPELTKGEIQRDYPRLVKAHARKADAIITVSHHTAKDVKELLEIPAEKIRTIPLGVEELFWEKASQQELNAIKRKLSISKDFILFVGIIEPRKNLPLLLRAFRQLISRGFSELQLVIAGERGWDYEQFDRELEDEKLKNRVIITGYLDRVDLRALYQQARLFAFPSLYEGFGLPLVEAMASGLPIVALKNSSIPEVVGKAAILLDEPDSQHFADEIERLFHDDSISEMLSNLGKEQAKRFSWAKTAFQTLTLYQELCSKS